jgi:hypothetical protein
VGIGAWSGSRHEAHEWVDLASVSTPLEAGEHLEFCAGGGSAAEPMVEIRDVQANQLMGSWTFLSIATCA